MLTACVVLLMPLRAGAQSPPIFAPQTHTVSQAGVNAALVGALVGAGAGVATGIGVGVALCDGTHCEGYAQDAFYFGAVGAAIGGVIGASIDLAHRRARSRRSPSITVAPILSPNARGGRVAVRF
jgi:hypothetical protein